jgi:FkbM family methyltransferase
MPVQAAISNKCGKQRFYVNRDSTTNSLLPIAEKVNRWVKPDAIRNISEIDVSVTTIDDFCIEKSIDRIDILKLDIQGGELMALEGAKRKLTDGSILLVYTEMLFVPIYKEEALFTDICSALAAHNYMLFNMYRFHHAKTGQLKWGDALFVSPRLTH